MNAEQTMARALQAKVVLENALVKEAFETMEREIVEQWEACPTRDKDAREWLWMYYKNTRKFKSIFLGMIESGKIAENAFKQERGFMERTLSKLRA